MYFVSTKPWSIFNKEANIRNKNAFIFDSEQNIQIIQLK